MQINIQNLNLINKDESISEVSLNTIDKDLEYLTKNLDDTRTEKVRAFLELWVDKLEICE